MQYSVYKKQNSGYSGYVGDGQPQNGTDPEHLSGPVRSDAIRRRLMGKGTPRPDRGTGGLTKLQGPPKPPSPPNIYG